MADEISIDTLKEFLQTLSGSAAESLKAFIEQMSNAGITTTKFGEIVKLVGEKAGESLKELSSAASDLTKNFGNFTEQAKLLKSTGSDLWSTMTNGLNDFINTQDLASHGFGVMGVQAGLALEPLIGIMPKSITGMGKLGDVGYESGSKISTAFAPIKPLFELAGKSTANLAEALTNGASAAFGLQREIIGIAAAQGRLNSVITDGGYSFGDLNTEYMDMTNLAYTAAQATGQTVSSVIDLAKTMGNIPGALSEPIKVGNENMSQLVATSQLATGFMVNQADVAKKLGDMYTNLGLRGEEAYNSLSNIYEKAGDSKLRFETFTITVMDIANNFKMLGDNTDAATKVVKSFDEAFKNSDISPAAMQQVISGMTSGLQKLNLARGAFVSGATGGPGGLAGAYQMEYALQTGGMEEVLSKTMRAMQDQFGGEIMTLKEAAENPALAGEFYKQVQYLTQVAGIAGDDREAYRILEAMKSGVIDSLETGIGGKEGQDALEKAISRGSNEQQKTNSILMTIHQDMELARLIQNNIYGGAIVQTSILMGMDETMKMASGGSATTGAIGADTFGNKKFVREDSRERIERYLEDAGSLIEPIVSIGKSIASEGTFNLMESKKRFGATAEETNLATAPVKIRGGTNSGMESIIPGENVNLRQPVGSNLEAIKGMSKAFENGEFPPLPINVSSQPLEVNINLSEPFNEKVRILANQEIEANQNAKIRQAGGGVPNP